MHAVVMVLSFLLTPANTIGWHISRRCRDFPDRHLWQKSWNAKPGQNGTDIIQALFRSRCRCICSHLIDCDYFMLIMTDLVLPLCDYNQMYSDIHRKFPPMHHAPESGYDTRYAGAGCSGTRMLFDYELKKARIDPKIIPGSEREVTTHIAVALAVKSGEADAGMCVFQCCKGTRAPVRSGCTGTVRDCIQEMTCRQSASVSPDNSNPISLIPGDSQLALGDTRQQRPGFFRLAR